MTREDMHILLRVADWMMHNKPNIMSKIRQLARTEENYLILACELDRVNAQIFRARSLRVEATLTLVDWLLIIDAYQWKCAYCQEKPFEVMHHSAPLALSGTTSTNCVPACCSCRTRRNKTLQSHVRPSSLLSDKQKTIQREARIRS